jgi:hypothetical protein
MAFFADALSILIGGVLGGLFNKKMAFGNYSALSLPLESKSLYSVGYLTKKDRSVTPILDDFLLILREFSKKIKP